MQPIENLELNDRCAVFVDQETGERVVCMGDGQTLPYRSFILEKVLENNILLLKFQQEDDKYI